MLDVYEKCEKGKNHMKAIVEFFKDILMLNQEEKIYIGLSQFKYAKEAVPVKSKPVPKKSDVKLSDLMRKTV